MWFIVVVEVWLTMDHGVVDDRPKCIDPFGKLIN